MNTDEAKLLNMIIEMIQYKCATQGTINCYSEAGLTIIINLSSLLFRFEAQHKGEPCGILQPVIACYPV